MQKEKKEEENLSKQWCLKKKTAHLGSDLNTWLCGIYDILQCKQTTKI